MQPVVSSYRVPLLLRVLATSSAIALISGCGVTPTTVSPASSGSLISGRVHGGQQPVSGSKIYLYAASNAGYSAPATSLLGGAGYVTTDSGGNFAITGTYTCPAGAYVYVLALGGNPGLKAGTNNADLALMNGLGPCSALQASTFIPINEVTTVATAYSLAQFMSSETLVGTSSTNTVGLQNAFATINNLLSTPQGFALATTPAGNGVVPQTEINSLANALAACVNSDGTGAPCSTLMAAANVTGAGGTPIDTIQAAINIAQNPGANVAAIYNNSTPNAPFQPALGSAPNDWSMSIVYSGGGIGVSEPQSISIDATGNVWTANTLIGTVTELSPQGAFLSPGNGYSNGQATSADGVAIDLSGNVWVSAYNASNQSAPFGGMEFTSNGNLLSTPSGFNGLCGSGSAPIVDASSNIWSMSYGLCKLNSAGTLLSPSLGYSILPNGFHAFGMASDTSGNIWLNGTYSTTTGNSTVWTWILAKVDTNGNLLSPTTGYQTTAGNYAGGIAIDHSGNIWAGTDTIFGLTISGGSIVKLSTSGALLSPATGYPAPSVSWIAVDGAGHVWFLTGSGGHAELADLANDGSPLSPPNGYAVSTGGISAAIDASGNLWQAGSSAVVETIGLAAPVITPVAKGVATNSLGIRP